MAKLVGWLAAWVKRGSKSMKSRRKAPAHHAVRGREVTRQIIIFAFSRDTAGRIQRCPAGQRPIVAVPVALPPRAYQRTDPKDTHRGSTVDRERREERLLHRGVAAAQRVAA